MTARDKPLRGSSPATLQSPSLTDALTAALRERIISGAIAAGERLTEAWVTESFAVARPTAKAALERLVGQGLLRRGARKSAIVPTLTRLDIEDIYLGREVVELRVVETLASTATVPREASRALRAMERAAEDAEYLEHVEADIGFHRALVAAIGSPRLQLMHETIMGESQLCIAQVQGRDLADLGTIARSHAAILDAISSGVPAEARAALLADLARARDSLISLLSESDRQTPG